MIAFFITLDGAIEWEFRLIVRRRIFHKNRLFLLSFLRLDIGEAVCLSEDDLGNA